jgi:hypothetical protein
MMASSTWLVIFSGSRGVKYFPDMMRSVSILSQNTQKPYLKPSLDHSGLRFFPFRLSNRAAERTMTSPETRIASQDILPMYVPGQLVT